MTKVRPEVLTVSAFCFRAHCAAVGAARWVGRMDVRARQAALAEESLLAEDRLCATAPVTDVCGCATLRRL